MSETSREVPRAGAEYRYWRANARALAAGNVLINIGWNASFAFLPLIVKSMGVERHLELWVGVMMFGYYGVSCLLTPVWGVLADYYGRKSMVLRAGFGMAVGFGLLAMTDDPVAFLIVLILTGLANGFVPAGQALVATSTPRTRVGGALALTQAGASVGTLVGPIIGAALIGMMPTMHSLFTVTSVAMFCAALLVLLVVREVHVRPQHALRIELRADLRQIMRVPDLKLLYFLEVLFASTVFGAMPIISLYTMHLIDQQPGFMGLKTETWLAITAMTFTIASIAVLPFWGRVLNRVEPQRVLKILLAGTCLTSVLIPLVRDPLELVIARVLFALFVSGLPATLIRMIRDRAPQGMEARTLSYGTAIQQLGSATAPLIAGVLAPYVGLRGFFGFASVLVLVAWVLWIRRGHAFRTRG